MKTNKKTNMNSSDLHIDDKNSWSTPQYIFDWLNSRFDFDLDLCASDNNHKVAEYFTLKDNALLIDWSKWAEAAALDITIPLKKQYSGFCNPPYGRGEIAPLIEKAVVEASKGFESVFLVPNTIEAAWADIDNAAEVIFITNGRLSFVHPLTGDPVAGNPKGSMILVYNLKGLKAKTKFKTIDRQSISDLPQQTRL
jgi:phage N-6-adenine-methyltransferase